jgi:hypothetical protein
MAQILVGDLRSCEIVSQEFGTRSFNIKAGSDHSFEFGGAFAVDDKSLITTNGIVVKKIETQRSTFSVTFNTANSEQDIQFLKDVSSSGQISSTTWVHVNGTPYTSDCFPVGDVEYKANDGEIDVTFQGTKISQLAP